VKGICSVCLAAGILIAAILAQAPNPRKGAEKKEEDHPRERAKWFYHQRAYPHQRIPPGARMRAVQEMDRIDAVARARHQTFAGAAPVNAPQAVSTSAPWSSLGPQPTHCSSNYCADVPLNNLVPDYLDSSGRITALAVDLTNADTVYAGGALGGVWKTTDGGKIWKALTDSQTSLAIGSLAIDPQNHDTIYAGTGEANNSGDSYYGAGILKSTDGGDNWKDIPGPFVQPVAQHIGALAVSPRASNTVIAGADGGIYLSSDAGNTWKPVLTEAPGTAVVFDPSNPSTVYAALGDPCGATCGISGNGVYKSSDGGNTWTQQTGSGANAFPKTGVGRIALAMSPSTPTTLYAAVQDGSELISSNPTAPLLGVWKTTDSGNTWNEMGQPPDDNSSGEIFCGFNGQCDYDLVIQVHPQNPNVVVVGGVTLALSTNGQNFNSLPLEYAPNGNYGYAVHVDQHAIAFSADRTKVYFGNDGGVWSAPASDILTGGTVNFTNLNQKLALTQFYAAYRFSPTVQTRFWAELRIMERSYRPEAPGATSLAETAGIRRSTLRFQHCSMECFLQLARVSTYGSHTICPTKVLL
jgi:hypothetical protein